MEINLRFFSPFSRWTFYCIFVFTTGLRWTIKLESSIHLIKFISILRQSLLRALLKNFHLERDESTRQKPVGVWNLKLQMIHNLWLCYRLVWQGLPQQHKKNRHEIKEGQKINRQNITEGKKWKIYKLETWKKKLCVLITHWTFRWSNARKGKRDGENGEKIILSTNSFESWENPSNKSSQHKDTFFLK